MLSTAAVICFGVGVLCLASRWLSDRAINRPIGRPSKPDTEAFSRSDTKDSSNHDLVSWTLSGTYAADEPILIDAEDPSRWLSRRRATELVARLAGSFEADRTVCLHMPNDIIYPVLFLAILASGSRWTGTNPAYTANELQHHFRLSRASYVITTLDLLTTVEAAVATLDDANIEIILTEDVLSDAGTLPRSEWSLVKRYRTLRTLLRPADCPSLRSRLANIDCDAVASIMSTSGTTGLPKMIQRTHHDLVLESRATEDNNALKPYRIRRLYCTPIFHAFSFPEMVINSLRLGLPSYYMRRFDDSFAQKICSFGITETVAAPPILLRLTDLAQDDNTRRGMQSLRMVLCAGAALSSQVRTRFLRIFNQQVRIAQVWGMSEGGWFATFKHPENDETGSVGYPLTGCEVRLADHRIGPDGSIVPSELLVRAPYMASHYLDNPEATTESFEAGGWLRTGDIGYVKGGRIYLVDRAKDMIKVNGWSVSPAELEAALYQNAQVADAAVVGHGKGIEERPVAFVVPVRASEVSPADITTHLLQYVSRFKVTKCEVRFVSSIPRNPSGKILRKLLRQQLEQEVGR